MSKTILYSCLFGILFGICFPLSAWIIDLIINKHAFSLTNISVIHSNNLLHWIIDIAPFILGLMGYIIGVQRQRLESYSQGLEQEVEKRIKQASQAKEQASQAKEQAIKARNEAIEANKAKSQFLSNMSHELRTPMHGILSFARFGIKNIEKEDKEKNLTYFTCINTCGERLLALLNDLLDISKLEAGKMTYDFETAKLITLIDNVKNEFSAKIKEKNLRLIIIPPDFSSQLVCDSRKITQVISNLVSNAIKFTDAGKNITVSLTETTLDNRSAIELSVVDQGVGIPDTELEFIFDKFIQSSKTKTNSGGTGLGLAISQELIHGHHGKIWVEHNPEGGSIFKFVLPLLQAA